MIDGIDVSRWQGEMDWRKAKAAGALFAWIKASEGSDWTDPEYADNAKCAGGAGLVWAPYHYYRNSIDPVAQATQFTKVVLNAGGSNRALPPAIDLEDTKSPVDPTALRTFVEAVAARLGRPIIYTGAWWMRLQDAGALAFLAAYPLWLAHYGTATPVVPAPWRDWDVWQWASKGSGSAFGASSEFIDRNRFRGTLNGLVALARPIGAPAPVSETPPIDELVAAARAEHEAHGVRLNPMAGLQREMLADGLVPTTNEATFTWPGGSVVWQRGEALAAGGGWLYWWDSDAGRVVKVRLPA